VLLPDRDPQGWAVKALREAGSSFASEFAGLDEDALKRRPADGELCLKEIAAHVRDACELTRSQLQAIIDRPGRTIPHQDLDLLPLERDYRRTDIRQVIAGLRSAHRDLTVELWGLGGPEWRLAGRHPYLGEVTIEQITRELAQHTMEHLWQVRRLKSEMELPVRVSDDWDDAPW
jgi:hypothetical protein